MYVHHRGLRRSDPAAAEMGRCTRQWLRERRRFYPPGLNRDLELFLGSGAVFVALHASGRLRQHKTIFVDSNADLIGC